MIGGPKTSSYTSSPVCGRSRIRDAHATIADLINLWILQWLMLGITFY
jgi:hypothetical protein